MLAKSLIYLCVVPLGAIAACLDRDSALSSAVELSANGDMHYPPSGRQYPVRDRPDHHPHPPKEVHGTIYEFISKSPKFTLVTKALNFEEKIAALLSDSSAKLTFFAPPDEVLRHKHRHHHNHTQLWDEMTADPLNILEHADLASALDLMDNVDNPDVAGDPEKKKRFIKFILHVILSYHVLDAEYDIEKLGAHNTIPTHLNLHHNLFDNQPIRMRIERTLIPPVTWINFFARTIFTNIPATNGFVHVVNKPLIPPPSVFQELYMVPEYFSTLTSAIQRSKLTDLLDFRHVHHTDTFEGANLVTVFAPTNHAFERLPKKLKLFLFSPFGERVMQKLLRYHIVPEVAFFSDYIHHKEQPDFMDFKELVGEYKKPARDRFFSLDWPRRRKGPVIEPISCDKYVLETALFNHTLDVIVDKKRITLPVPRRSAIKTSVVVNHQLVLARDVVGLNGAIHVVNRLLDPRKHCHPPEDEDHEDQAWEDWEEWLPRWAEEVDAQ